MSQKAVEGLLGRLLTDTAFRHRFYRDPRVTCAHTALELTARELEAVLALDEAHVADFAKRLDPKIVRATTEPSLHASLAKSTHKTRRAAG
jgi:hypothetical protein